MTVDVHSDDRGFGLVELIIAMFLLAVIATSILAVLWNGIRYSAEQPVKAAATRELNSLIESARSAHTCAAVATAASSHTVLDDNGQTVVTTSGTTGPCPSSTTGGTMSIEITARHEGADIAAVKALVYIPADGA